MFGCSAAAPRVGGPGGEEQRRRIATREGDRLAQPQVAGGGEDLPMVRVAQRQKIVRTGQTGRAGDVAVRIQPLGAQPLLVQRQHDRVVGAGGVPHQEDPVRIAAVPRDIRLRPGDRGGIVAQERRKPHRREQPVIRHHGQEATCRQRRRDEAVFAPVPVLPAAAVNEHDDRGRALPRRRVDIQFVAITGRIANIPRLGDAGLGRQSVQDGDGGTGGQHAQHQQPPKPTHHQRLVPDHARQTEQATQPQVSEAMIQRQGSVPTTTND